MGFAIGTRDGKELLFNDLNEAVITELAIRFERKYFNEWPELRQEINDRDGQIKEIAEREGVAVEEVRKTVGFVEKEEFPGSTRFHWTSFSYHDARKNFNLMIDELYEKNKADFSSREAVFTLFAKATLDGRLLPVARLIEKTFGKGSFRMIGKKVAISRMI